MNMRQFTNLEDTIAAISTPAGPGGIGIVRLSGGQSLAIAGRIFAAKNKIRTDRGKENA